MSNFFKGAGLVCVILLTFMSRPCAAQESFADKYADEIEALLHEQFDENNAGMVVALIDEHGSRVFSAGVLDNDADNGADQQVDGDTIFELGSVTKVFTSLLMLDAARRGELHPDDLVADHLPADVKLPMFDGQPITLVNLAAQESGLPWHPHKLQKELDEGGLKGLKRAADAFTIDDLYAFLPQATLTIKPGENFQYSNVGMALLGNVVERKTGRDYEDLVVERICRPLNMESTRITLSPELKLRLAAGHWVDGTRAEHVNFQANRPAGSFLSTANDLLKFLAVNLGFADSELAPLMKQMYVVRHRDAPRFGKTAMPWFDQGVYNPPGADIWGHGGGGLGNLAFVGFDANQRRGVVVLTNQMKFSPYGVGWTLLQDLPLSRENITYWVREIVGIGIALELDEATGKVRVGTVFPESPAGKAGITSGLLLEKVGDVATSGKDLQETLRLIGGPLGGQVRLELFDPEKQSSQTVELTRSKFITARGGGLRTAPEQG